jgi:hypothetical protein
MIGFITPYTIPQSRITGTTALSLFYSLCSSPLHKHKCSQFSPVDPGNGIFTVSLQLQLTHDGFFAPPNSVLAIILQLPIPKTRHSTSRLLLSTHLRCFYFVASSDCALYNTSVWTPRETPPSIFEDTCLLVLSSKARVLRNCYETLRYQALKLKRKTGISTILIFQANIL